MCGIFGIISGKKSEFSPKLLKSTINNLFKLSESRGKEAAGIAVLSGDSIYIYKQPVTGSKLIRREKYNKLLNERLNHQNPIAVIGHSRLATSGLQVNNNNNQPVVSGDAVGVHNGIIVNDEALWNKFPSMKRNFEVDTEVLLSLINLFYRKGFVLEDTVKNTFKLIDSSASIACFLSNSSEMVLATNTGSLYICTSNSSDALIFASESYILRTLLQNEELVKVMKNFKFSHLHAGNGYLVDIFNLKMRKFSLDSEVSSQKLKNQPKKYFLIKDISATDEIPNEQSSLLASSIKENNLEKLKCHIPPFEKIYKLRRCIKCILPKTMPLIKFDESGICNYCHNYKKRHFRGEEELEKLVAPFRNKSGEPDCIVAFSGGRDSSFGLHYVKNVLRMNPIAYTYDWGMVTDLARRNQARITGKLGIEHVIVSADIKKKRENIRKNVLAWLKKPDIGMVPLFMAGDKQAEYYADELKRKTNIKLAIYCRGNELENEEFKWGYCGIRNGSPGGVLHNLSLMGKIQLAAYYGKEYLLNPAYINSSLFDTLFAYFVAYIMPLDFVYLWHYIKWDEEEIITTLKNEYGWETATDSKVTWRIDDGSVPFYNYIYYTVTGFTENDTFRSNQIREGILSRKEALELVNEENKPRYGGLKWYFDQIGIDGDVVLSKVDSIPKLYEIRRSC